MTPISCIIIDDEPLATEILKDFTGKMPGLSLQAVFLDSVQALDYLNNKVTDLAFLDIQMPDLNGIELMKRLKNRPQIILTTAFPEFAMDGYQFDVAGFLLKPISFTKFLEAVQKAEEKLTGKRSAEQLNTKHPFLFVRTEYKLLKINFDDILYIEGLKDYSKIYTTQQTKAVVTLQSLKSFEEKLPSDEFIRVHRSYIVPLNKIDTIYKNSILIGKTEIPVSDSFRATLHGIVSKYT